ncbi:Uma2 family endonuclease [Chamaesiphon sp. VAR_48_metabat_135_sub]|uniref:Uma2 family endonuclease n=1 Tax=Chamaesiphon sp. VAR_48_metabat_135_sub TaxID=2964699 RepID=UPI00286C0988|nr:Uma2 family endonuclease [Chamaesiphon sp. VAR_48_metabat_135_sub]
MTVLKTLPDLHSGASALAEPLSMKIAIESSSSICLKYWTVQDYYRMSELGILDPNERTELIDGQIIIMTAKGTPHVTTLQLLATNLQDQLGKSALIRTQDPIRLDNFSEPEPDLAIVKGTILDYNEHHPVPNDIDLIIEVADSTLKQDCEVKDKLYARSSIAEYWVVDIKNRQVHIFRDPTPTGYTSQLILTETHSISPLAFPNLSLSIASILPPI